jgi:hypothetical protein
MLRHSAKLSALRTGRDLLPRLSEPQGLVRSEGLGKLEKLIHLIGCRAATFRFVAQCLKHYQLRLSLNKHSAMKTHGEVEALVT